MLAFPATCIILALLSFAKGVILGASLALSGAKYNRPSGKENKHQNNLKVTFLKQVSKNLPHDKFSENRFFLSCRATGEVYSRLLLIIYILSKYFLKA